MWNIFNREAENLSDAESLFKRMKVAYETQPDGTLFVPGDLDLSGRDLAKLPDLSNVIVGGNFNCENNLLTSLRGSPKEVRGDFLCGYNILLNTEGVTPKIGGGFHAEHNHLLAQNKAPQLRSPGV